MSMLDTIEDAIWVTSNLLQTQRVWRNYGEFPHGKAMIGAEE